MRTRLYILLAVVGVLCTGCKRTNWQSSVPNYPIHFEINTNVGMFVNFVPENVTTYLIVDAAGYHLNGITLPLPSTDAYGFAGTVVYIDGFHPYGAYDLCCPNCLKQDKPCQVNGMFAICPECGEEYDIYSGNGVPTHGIAKEALKQYQVTYNAGTGKLFVGPKN
ncbi:MAG: hypothetical protein IJT12_05335 [Paludibacteraceae bacterium]|nr:hypothetical protein [Paludibacteraceae bacterium]